MRNAYPLDLAVRAGNLTERMRTVAKLGETTALPSATAALDAFDSWRINRLAGKLADKFQQESLHRSVPPPHTRDELADVLSAYRRIELNLASADDATRGFLADLHSSWLPAYQAALDGFDAEPDGDGPRADDGASRRKFDVHYRRLGKACEPFLLDLGRILHGARARAAGPERAELCSGLVEDFQEHLLGRFELMLAWAVEADAHVHCRQAGIDEAAATSEDYLAYLRSTFADAESYHRFYLKFPVLGRRLAHVTALLSAFGQELFGRLAADAARIADAFFDRPITEFRSIRPGRSDFHAGGRSVVLVEAGLADGSAASFYYKPRCIRSEAALQELLGRLAADEVIGFATRPVLAMDGYGYEAAIPSGRNHASSRAQVAHIYQELGGYLGLFYVLGGGDLHFENVIIADGHAFVCDGETVLGAVPQARGRPEGTLMDSVFTTGLLEWPSTGEPSEGALAQMKISGYGGGEGYRMPIPVPRINDRRLTFAASVEYRDGIQVEPSPSNRVFLGETLVRPEDFAESITSGFNRVYDWFKSRPEEAIRRVRDIFGETSVRCINRGTQVYSQLLAAAHHPKCLSESLEVDLLANTVRTFPRTWDPDSVLAAREVSSLWRLDVPIFTVPADGTHLVHDHCEELASSLETSPLDWAAARIRGLSEQNRARQNQYLSAGLTTGRVTSPSFVATSLDHAARIGTRFCQELRDPAASAPWISYELTGRQVTEVDIEADLYQGSAGVALFLAYLNELVPRREFRHAAQRALDHALARWDTERLGAFSGLGGIIYLLTHLHHLWRDGKLLDLAVRLSEDLPRRIAEDRHFDVLHGAAGLIPVLLGLAHQTSGHGPGHADGPDHGRGGPVVELAHKCAEHLLCHAESDGETLSWPLFDPDEADANLTGFSHGAGGIGWALIELGRHTGRQEYIEAGHKAFAYEAGHYDEQEQDWYDLRTSPGGVARRGRHFANAWCNGAAGIGLSRIASWAALGRSDEALLRQAYQALSATMRNFPRLRNHTLCHGTSGNAELFLRFAELRGEPAYRLEANVQVQALWVAFDDAHNGTAESSANFFPGLMIGICGFGMHFLRLAAPERVPSVLLLDPPRHQAPPAEGALP